MSTKLHIGNIPRNSTLQDIEGIFQEFGIIDSILITKDPQTGLSTGCGVVEMANDSDAQSAINCLNFTQYGGHTIGVSRARGA